MKRSLARALPLLLAVWWLSCSAQMAPEVVDISTRDGVTERIFYIAQKDAKAAVILLAGGNGGLQIQPDGRFTLEGNFLVRTRGQFADHGLAVVVVDAPSDRPAPQFLEGFRQTPEHATDIAAVIAWLRRKTKLPVWLIGTSRGTQSAAYVAIERAPAAGGPDGLVLTSTILQDKRGRPVPMMPLEKVAIPVLVVHHEDDGCAFCRYAEIPNLMQKLVAAPKKELITVTGGASRGDPCGAFAYHGYNGREADVVAKIAAWIVSH